VETALNRHQCSGRRNPRETWSFCQFEIGQPRPTFGCFELALALYVCFLLLLINVALRIESLPSSTQSRYNSFISQRVKRTINTGVRVLAAAAFYPQKERNQPNTKVKREEEQKEEKRKWVRMKVSRARDSFGS
jgi:hypothetical protein